MTENTTWLSFPPAMPSAMRRSPNRIIACCSPKCSPIPMAIARKRVSTPWACSPARPCAARRPGRSKAIPSTTFTIDLTPAQITAFFDSTDPRPLALDPSRHSDHAHPLRPRACPGLRSLDRPRDPCQRPRAGAGNQGPTAFCLFRWLRPRGANQGPGGARPARP